jgi:hypothetical protein
MRVEGCSAPQDFSMVGIAIKDGNQLGAGMGSCAGDKYCYILGLVRVSRTYLAWLTSGGTNGFSVRILNIYDASRLQGGLPFGGHQRMM